MKLKTKFPAVHLTLLVLTVSLVVAGCKKKPPPVVDEPEPPRVERTAPPPEPVQEQPMRTVEEKPAPPPSMTIMEAQRLLKAIYFDFDRYEVRPDQRPTLQANAELLKNKLSNFRLVIEGHCDERGTNEYNMTLGDRRANAARQYLIDLGISPARIRTISYGEERPSDPGHNETAWARNRRGEFLLEEG